MSYIKHISTDKPGSQEARARGQRGVDRRSPIETDGRSDITQRISESEYNEIWNMSSDIGYS
jgi:hypothetical protein